MVDLFILSPGDSQFVSDVVGKVLSRCLHHVSHPLGGFPCDTVELLYCQLEQNNLRRERGGRKGASSDQVKEGKRKGTRGKSVRLTVREVQQGRLSC